MNTNITKKALTYWNNDKEFIEHKIFGIKDIDNGYELHLDDNSWINVPKIDHQTPSIGDIIKLFGKGFGYTIRGIEIAGKLYRYRTPEEAEADHNKEQEKLRKGRIAQFEKEKSKLDKIFESLPEPFQKRIERFRNNNPDFRWDFEAYESFVCQEAWLIALKLKHVAMINNFKNMPWDAQRKLVPIDANHSGHTFDCAILLAKTFIENPENVVNVHGAMCPIVGCETYGCVSKVK